MKDRERSIVHDTFRIERTFEASVARVFEAFSNLENKVKWFSGPETWVTARRELEFRVGGQEVLSGGPTGGALHTFVARYFDIVPERRIVYAYDMYVGEQKLSVSLASIELVPRGARRTELTITEQGAYLDGMEDGSQRREGTERLMDRLGNSLQS
jgi:uncharacterized protein YndB with AHSA1/START domain